MSASIAPYLQDRPLHLKVLAAFMLSDESYALAIARYTSGQGSFGYLIGANLGLYVEWAVASLGGALLGSSLPDLSVYRLDLIFPLAFLGLLVPLITNRVTLVVALVASLLALGTSVLLSGTWYIIVAGLGASATGLALEDLWKRH